MSENQASVNPRLVEQFVSTFSVLNIKSEETYEWLLNKHYAKRLCPISFAFGLYDGTKTLVGVSTFGDGGGATNLHNIVEGYPMLELNRLVVNEGLPKNVLSFFVSRCLKMIPKPRVLVSYADPAWKHNGYIYQATNWIYTGQIDRDGHPDIFIDGVLTHAKSLYDKHGSSGVPFLKKIYGERMVCKEKKQKHRYFYFLGTKKQIKDMKAKLKYETKSYPKGDNGRYEATYKPQTQGILF